MTYHVKRCEKCEVNFPVNLFGDDNEVFLKDKKYKYCDDCKEKWFDEYCLCVYCGKKITLDQLKYQNSMCDDCHS